MEGHNKLCKSKYIIIATVCCVLFGTQQTRSEERSHEVKRYKRELVSTAADAIEITRVLARRVYGAENVARQEPLIATKHRGTWVVEGTCHADLGGVLTFEIRASDCSVIKFWHSK